VVVFLREQYAKITELVKAGKYLVLENLKFVTKDSQPRPEEIPCEHKFVIQSTPELKVRGVAVAGWQEQSFARDGGWGWRWKVNGVMGSCIRVSPVQSSWAIWIPLA